MDVVHSGAWQPMVKKQQKVWHKRKMKWTAENKVKAGAAGGIEAAVKAINTHINNADVCQFGCHALWNMTNNGKNTDKAPINENEMKWTAENQVKAGAAGGIEAVVKAINTHISNAGVCDAGCGALWNMTFNGKNTTENTDNNKMKWNEQLRTKWRQEQ